MVEQECKENSLHIRRARRTDLEVIVQLLAEDALGAKREQPTLPLPSSYLAAFEVIDQDPNSELLVAELGGVIVGTCHLTILTYLGHQGRKVAQIESVRIKKELRGQGWGKRMMEWVLARARERQCHRVQLTTHKSRKDAHRFYESLGFAVTHEGMKLIL